MRVLGPNLQALTAAGGGDGDRSEVADMVRHLSPIFKGLESIL
jgi:hypothetical protein